MGNDEPSKVVNILYLLALIRKGPPYAERLLTDVGRARSRRDPISVFRVNAALIDMYELEQIFIRLHLPCAVAMHLRLVNDSNEVKRVNSDLRRNTHSSLVAWRVTCESEMAYGNT